MSGRHATERAAAWTAAVILAVLGMIGPAAAAEAGTSAQPLAIQMFGIFVAATLIITVWAARQSGTAKEFYAAGGRITGFQNGMAIAGDFMSAATFLGITGLVYLAGFDAIIYLLSPMFGFTFILLVMAEPLHNLGKYTFADVASYRLGQTEIRSLAACGTLAVTLMYMIAQIVGAGTLIQVLFGLPYGFAVILVGVLMMLYVTVGGMLATTWVQIIKAALLLIGVSILAFAVLIRFNFDLGGLVDSAVAVHPRGAALLAPGGLVPDPLSALSLGIGLMFGFSGLPHILMRLFTVPDFRAARRSVLVATGIIGYVFVLMFFVVGFGGIALVIDDPRFVDAAGRLIGGNNMVAVHLSKVVGGDLLLGFISAVAFATILAVVAGLTLAGASTVSHDLYASLFRRGRVSERDEVLISRIATVAIGVIAIGLGILFEGQNVVYLAGLSLAIAASVNFPVLILSMYWSRLTTRGALIGGFMGLGAAIVLVVLGPTVWVDILGNAQAIFPYKHPGLFSMTIGFLGVWLFSVTDRSERAGREQAAFAAQYVRAQTGHVGAEPAPETSP